MFELYITEHLCAYSCVWVYYMMLCAHTDFSSLYMNEGLTTPIGDACFSIVLFMNFNPSWTCPVV